jgi:hypothetical protein
MMPERIWAYLMPGGGKSKLRFWKPRPLKQYGGEDAEYVRADVAEADKRAAVAREREACAQIAQRVADEALMKREESSPGDSYYHYHDGMSDAGEQIADEISSRG